MHLAVHVKPLRHDGSSAKQALAVREHLSTKQVWSTSELSKPLPPYLAANSSSACTGVAAVARMRLVDKRVAVAMFDSVLEIFDVNDSWLSCRVPWRVEGVTDERRVGAESRYWWSSYHLQILLASQSATTTGIASQELPTSST